MCRTFFSGTCLFMLLGVSLAAAQTEKGSKLIGATLGGASYASGTTTVTIPDTGMDRVSEQKSDSYSILVSPRVGWFVKDDLALGASVSVSYSKGTSDLSSNVSPTTETVTTTSPNVFVGPFVRYYLGGSASAKPFVEATVAVAFDPVQVKASNSLDEHFESRVTPKGHYGAGLMVGYEHFLNKSLGLVFSSGVNYAYRKAEIRSTWNYPSFAFTETRTQTNKGWMIPFNVGLEIHL